MALSHTLPLGAATDNAGISADARLQNKWPTFAQYGTLVMTITTKYHDSLATAI